jgi:hypothetical protein
MKMRIRSEDKTFSSFLCLIPPFSLIDIEGIDAAWPVLGKQEPHMRQTVIPDPASRLALSAACAEQVGRLEVAALQ